MKWLLTLAFLIASLGAGFISPASAQEIVRPCTEIPAQTGQANTNCQNTTRSFPFSVTGNSAIPTYSVGIAGLGVTTSGDVFCIQGSGTKTVKVKGIRVSGTSTGGSVIDAEIVLRSSIDSTTSTSGSSQTLVAADPNNNAATATVETWATPPTTVGTSLGVYRAQKVGVLTSSTGANPGLALFQFSPYWDQPIILRSASQAACVSVSAVGIGGSLDIDEEHTEEPVGYQ